MHDVSTVGALGTILGIWAHPDDEALPLVRAHGPRPPSRSRVVVGHATLGGAGTDDPDQWPAERLARHRRAELEALWTPSASTSTTGWATRTANATVADDEGIAAVTTLIERVRPSTIVTFGPEGMTGHPDHRRLPLDDGGMGAVGTRHPALVRDPGYRLPRALGRAERRGRSVERRRAASNADRRSRRRAPPLRPGPRRQAGGAARPRIPDGRPGRPRRCRPLPAWWSVEYFREASPITTGGHAHPD